MSGPVTLGLDFGTESVRALVLDLESRCELAVASATYPHGVIARNLPQGRTLPAEWALQNPRDWRSAAEAAVGQALTSAEIDAESVIGIGVDFTASTILPTTNAGTPLCELEQWRDEPHAWPKLWKHHAAQPQAAELTDLMAQQDPQRLDCYGGKVSSEWLVPKAAEILDEAPEVFAAAEQIVEASDWLVWQLTGELVRNSCAAGFKALWQKESGYPDAELLHALRPGLAGLFQGPGSGPVVQPGTPAGTLRPDWQERLGLAGVEVGAAIIDAHAGLLGAGVTEPGVLYMATGTSTCHLLLAPWQHVVPGISGVVEDGIFEAVCAYEAGQASVGDMFDWYLGLIGSSHAELTRGASVLAPGESGLLALDWWNGSRTPLTDADLTGVIVGASLDTAPTAIYRSLLEATAFGTRLVVDTFTDAGVAVDRLVAGGGLTGNELMLQIYADVTGLPIEVVSSEQASARGAATLAAATAGVYADVAAATGALALPPRIVVEPRDDAHAVYCELYALYRELVATYGGENSVLKRLNALRRQINQAGLRPMPVRL